MTKTDRQANGGIGFLGLLTILFIALKLTNVITWSWWWVMAPMWIPVVCVLTLALVFGALVSKDLAPRSSK